MLVQVLTAADLLTQSSSSAAAQADATLTHISLTCTTAGRPLNSSKAGIKCSFFVLSAQSLESSALSDWLIKFTITVLRNLVEISHDK